MGWDVNESMVRELVDSDEGVGIETRLQALAVFQHCSIRDMTLFEFFAQYRVVGMRLIPFESPAGVEVHAEHPEYSQPAAAAFAEGEFPQPRESDVYESDWKFTDWRNQTVSSNRLEYLRKHIAEVAASWGSECVLWHDLRRMEASLARVVEPVPTLGMVADDDVESDEFPEPETEPESDVQPACDDAVERTPVIPPPSAAEKADIAAVLANPKAAGPVVDSSPRKDAQGRVLASDATIADLYACGDRLGMNKIAVQELACAKFGLRNIDDLPELTAQKVIANMRAKAASA